MKLKLLCLSTFSALLPFSHSFNSTRFEQECARSVTITVDQAYTEDWLLRVSTGDSVLDVNAVASASNSWWVLHESKTRSFSFSLAPGGPYSLTFLDEGGNVAWPIFAHDVWSAPPSCESYATPQDVVFVKPEFVAGECDDLIVNGGQSPVIDSVLPWKHTGGGVAVDPTGGIDGSPAFTTTNRDSPWEGIGINLDSRCLELNSGKYYLLQAQFLLLQNGEPSSCIPGQNHNSGGCPTASVKLFRYSSTAKESVYQQSVGKKAMASSPTHAGWNTLQGIFKISEAYAQSARVFVYVEKAPSDRVILLDNVSFTLMECDPEEIIKNGDFVSGYSTFWENWGSTTLDIVTGFGETDYALISRYRGHLTHGVYQAVDMSCAKEGDRLAITARVRVEASGATSTCSTTTYSSSKCPETKLTVYNNGSSQTHKFGFVTSPHPEGDGWYHLSGVISLNSFVENADKTVIIVDGIDTSKDIVIDDVELKSVPLDCNALVLNPSFETGLNSFWGTNDRRYSRLIVEGPGFDDDYALRSYARSGNARGPRTSLDPRCFQDGSLYTITAQFKLITKSGGNPASCDTARQDGSNSQCPVFVIVADGCAGSSVFMTVYNELGYAWDDAAFNPFKATFVVDENLASCSSVNLDIRDANRNWDIIFDNVQISPFMSVSPTKSPSGSPTASPTQSPTFTPTINNMMEVQAGPISLLNSDHTGSLVVLVKSVTHNGELKGTIPIARSYDGRPWEATAGDFAKELSYQQQWTSDGAESQIVLPELLDGESYYTSFYEYELGEKDTIARFLNTATFGATAQDIANWDRGAVTVASASSWIQDQMLEQETSHREYFRKRTNPRFREIRYMGIANHPCDAQSRWRQFTFSKKDGHLYWDKQYVGTIGDGPYVITLNGIPRTTVDNLLFDNPSYTFNHTREYMLCLKPDERIDGAFRIRAEDGTCQPLRNPPIYFDETTMSHISYPIVELPAQGEGMTVIDAYLNDGEEFLLTNGLDDEVCTQLPAVTSINTPIVFGRTPDGTWFQFDPRLKLNTNTPEDHMEDAGGMIPLLTNDYAQCSRVTQSPFNEDQCTLATDSNTCRHVTGRSGIIIDIQPDALLAFHDLTGLYVYSIIGLPLQKADGTPLDNPCTPGVTSRWEISSGECTPTILGEETNSTLFQLLSESTDENSFVRDITSPADAICSAADENLVDITMLIGDQCFQRVHPEHMSVYDVSYCTRDDNPCYLTISGTNPIAAPLDNDGSVFLNSEDIIDPFWEEVPKFFKVGRFGDSVVFRNLPNHMRLDAVADYFGSYSGGVGVVICGSPNEVSNDPSLGNHFEVYTGRDTSANLYAQREFVWAEIVMWGKDQLRQRMAWALAQLLVVVPAATEIGFTHTEVFLAYYDIFVRNAFGNYRDILKEITYSPLMAENLSYLNSKSAAYVFEKWGRRTFADENFAREIMQLFTTGLTKINDDGTEKRDEFGQSLRTYTNEEIMSFARIFTGFEHTLARGNYEESRRDTNRLDPLDIEAAYHDRFPKSDLAGGYIGDGYPLCTDLPDKMFLRKGAVYKLIGDSSFPVSYSDPGYFYSDPTVKRLALDESSLLRAKLCNSEDGGPCQFQTKVTLDSNLDCTGQECMADTLRSVHVSDGIYYEYIRPACVEQVFHNDAKKVHYINANNEAMCANPLLPYASEACCRAGTKSAHRYSAYLYDQERVKFSTANDRCEANGRVTCDFNYLFGIEWYKRGYLWTNTHCSILAKVKADGHVAIIYKPDNYNKIHKSVREDNNNFFKVYWDGDYPKTENSCASGACSSLGSACICNATVSVEPVFTSMPESTEEVLSMLLIGAFDPSAYDVGTYTEETSNGITAYLKAGIYDAETVFKVINNAGKIRFFKNSKETVNIMGGSEFSFRNAPSFVSMIDNEASKRDAMHEVDAALDHLMYHDNTAPFIAFRLIQRFTTSNPSPRYLKAVASAFRNGSYEGFGTGEYGDLAATIAAVLLDPEALSTVLDLDPFHGLLREPIIKVMGFMRSMELEKPIYKPVLEVNRWNFKFGQAPFSFPSVFSFFLPEHRPHGRPGFATLVGPEEMLLDMPRITGLMNGLFSTIKYGLSSCYGGLGQGIVSDGCIEGDYSNAVATLSFERNYDPSSETPEEHAIAVIDELATMLTSGRLGAENRRLIKEAYIGLLPDEAAALRFAQQLIVMTPEFHTTNSITKTRGISREPPTLPEPMGSSYKALVFVMLTGGCDSFNMIVPHTCERDLYSEYVEIRQQIAIQPKTSLLEIDASSSDQICSSFGVHPKLSDIKDLYTNGDLLFFANAGVLTKPTDKLNYNADTATQLFAHNFMQKEIASLDPFGEKPNTGVFGRVGDALEAKGLSVGRFTLSGGSVAVSGDPKTATKPFKISGSGIAKFNDDPSSENMQDLLRALNEETTADSGAFADLWSESLLDSVATSESLSDALAESGTTVFFQGDDLGSQLKMISDLIAVREARGVDRDIFFLTFDGWDTHGHTEKKLNYLFDDVNAAFKSFSEAMKASGTWDDVTLIQTSDFGRTLEPNSGDGTDHAWGGNYMMMGGSVKGGNIFGKYPENLTEDGPDILERGRVIPSTSWDAIFLPISEWLGASPEDMEDIFPNKGNFPPSHFFESGDLFEYLTTPESSLFSL